MNNAPTVYCARRPPDLSISKKKAVLKLLWPCLVEVRKCFHLKSSNYELRNIYLPDCEIIIYAD